MSILKSNRYLGNRALVAFVFAFIFSIVFGVFSYLGLFHKFSQRLSNFYYNENSVSNDIVIVAIDDKSTKPNKLGSRLFWSRRYYADVLKNIDAAKPNAVFFDIIFSSGFDGLRRYDIQEFLNKYDENKSSRTKYKDSFEFLYDNLFVSTNTIDLYFADALENAKNVYLPMRPDSNGFIAVYKMFAQRVKQVSVMISISNGFVYDTPLYVEYSDGIVESLAMAIARKKINANPFKKSDIENSVVNLYSGKKNIRIPVKNNGRMMINYFGVPGSYKRVSFVDVLNGNIDDSVFKDKIVLIGITTLKNKEDMVLTPISNRFMPGVEVHANAIQTILDQKFLIMQDGWRLFVMLFVIMFVLFFAFSGLKLSEAVLGLILAYILYILIGKVSFKFGMVVNALYGYLSILVSYLGALMYKFFVLDSDKRMLADAFGHYVSPELVDKIVANPDSVKLTGEKRVLSVMFTDIKGSTTMAEGVAIDMWVKQMNEYFTVMESVVKKYHGTIDKYEGDAIMAFWNAPVVNADHVLLAYKAAVEMRFKLAALHNKWLKEGKPLIDFRAGVNTGEALIGNFGSVDRFNYTAMGDSVNVASRLESSVNKAYGVSSCVAGFESFYSREKLKELVLRQLDIVFVPGKTVPIVVYELVGLARFVSREKIAQIDLYHQGLNMYFKRDFTEAIKFFKQIQGDTPATILLNRCIALNAGHSYTDVGVEEVSMGFYIVNK